MSQKTYLPGKHYSFSWAILYKGMQTVVQSIRYNAWISWNIRSPSPMASSVEDIFIIVAVAIVQGLLGTRRTLLLPSPTPHPLIQQAMKAHIISLWSSCQAGEQMLYC